MFALTGISSPIFALGASESSSPAGAAPPPPILQPADDSQSQAPLTSVSAPRARSKKKVWSQPAIPLPDAAHFKAEVVITRTEPGYADIHRKPGQRKLQPTATHSEPAASVALQPSYVSALESHKLVCLAVMFA